MILSGDTTSLWRAGLGYVNTSCSGSRQTVLPLPLHPRPASSVQVSSNDDSSDDTELPYLCTEPAEIKGIAYTPLPVVDTFGPEIDSALLMAMLSGDDVAVETIEHSVSSRPTLYINTTPIVGSLVLSAPSPVDSGYGSRPDTPLVDTCEGYGSDESTWSPVDDTSSISDESSNTHMLFEGFSDAKYWNHVTDAKATSPASQGPVIPRIVLSDEEGRVVEATIDGQFGVFSRPEPSTVDQDADSPYGGLMSFAAPGDLEPASPVSCVSPVSKLRSSATGAVPDRAFVSLVRPRTAHSATTPVYHNRHRAPTFVLDCVGEEEEEEEEEQGDEDDEECARVGAGSILFMFEKQDGGCVKSEVECVMSVTEALKVGIPSEDIEYTVGCLTREECSAAEDSISYNATEPSSGDVQLAGSSALVSTVKNEFSTWSFEDEEDEECEECGLFLTEPDDNYRRLFGGPCELPSKPTIVFGLLKAVGRAPLVGDLNTAYHVTEQGRAFRTDSVPCSYDCEHGYWSTSGGLSSIVCPQDCPAHGGRGSCEVGAIFYRSDFPPSSTTELDYAPLDYQSLAAEIVGLAPFERKPAEEELDDGDLILHSGEKFRPTEVKNAPPKAGASYDEYMSRFMEDVDLSTSGSNDSLKNAPFGKLVGGTLKDMTVPEAVDHLKEGLEKTESAFRAALTAPFRFNSVADRLAQHLKSSDSKVHPPKERRASNAFRHHRKESSVSGIKTKWSNMLNKFTR
ncbi:unnamed protein product [Rhizoctonia solani]|uniref:Uncharacterized protein n=1 Tax=Rhizoctonia solani TaxID=456999 RepID=A0A8H3BB16_9AGAM|nr:unnamed protein product [Rhizoctonia solani]